MWLLAMSCVTLVSQWTLSVKPVQCLKSVILTVFIRTHHYIVSVNHFFMLQLTSGKGIKVENIVNVLNKT